MNFDIAVKGVDETAKGFLDAADDFMKNRLMALVSLAVDVVIPDAEANAPVASGPTPKGHAQGLVKARGIGWMWLKSNTATSVGAGIGFTKKGWYGIFSELGSSRESARPFITPAFERNKSQMLSAMGALVSQAAQSWQSAGSSGFLRPRSI